MNVKKNTVHYPRAVAKAETTSRRQHAVIYEQSGEALPDYKVHELTKAAFELAGAHPYVFDALAFVCTHYGESVERRERSTETHYRVRIPFTHFLDFALDGRLEYRNRLMAEIYELASAPKGKTLPFDANHSILTVPLRVELIHKDGRVVDPGTIRRLSNLNSEGVPIKMVTLEFYKPLFSSLFIGAYGRSWFPLPKAFHAKMLSEMDSCRALPEFKNAGIFAHPLQYRRLYLYMNLHDNGLGNTLNLDGAETLLSCYPSLVEGRGGENYVKWWPARLFIKKACSLFNRMADKGYMEGVKFIPTAIQYEKPLKQFRLSLQRGNYRGLPQFVDESPYASLPDLRPGEEAE
jgi:hypothetical protein